MADSEGYIHYGGELGPLLNSAVKDANARRNALLMSNLDIYGVNDMMQRMTLADITSRFATASDTVSQDLKDAVADFASKLGKDQNTTFGECNESANKTVARLKIA